MLSEELQPPYSHESVAVISLLASVVLVGAWMTGIVFVPMPKHEYRGAIATVVHAETERRNQVQLLQ